ncbi:MAG: pyridoxal-phosphate dependent enzyme [Actinobacteria bacterium]|nr:MAG: pyridoxal-phosphate dependent enzyme [Actinomycetota bacterium]
MPTVQELYELWAGDSELRDALQRSLEPRGIDSLFDAFAALGPRAGDLVVDVGARDARHAIRLVREHGLRAVALDPVPLHCELARKAIAEAELTSEIEVVEAPIESMPFADASVDWIWCRDVLVHVDVRRGLAECARVLRHGGALVAYVTLPTARLEPRERAELVDAMAIESFDRAHVEAAASDAGLLLRSVDELGSEWRERMIEDDLWDPDGLRVDILELIGNTPLVELARLSPKPSVRLYAKLEGQNPTGSIKDRVAKAMIDAAEASGELEPRRRLLEPTSGNTGISLALVAKLKGYPLTCVMPENATDERKRLLALYGAELVFSPGKEGSNGAVRLALELAERDPSFFMPFQYGNEANPQAHYEGTGAEIAEALDRVDVLVAGLGTGGTLMGAGDRLRESFPDVVVAAAEPLPGDPVMGLRSLEDGYVPPILDLAKLDRKLLVSNEESVAGVRALLDREGIFAGVSAGAVVHVARRLAAELDEGVVVCVLADGGWKYLSADFWDSPDVERSMERNVWW